MPELRLNSPLQYLKGVGPKRGDGLAKYGLRTIDDLLHYFPRAYLDRTNVTPIGKLRINEPATIIGEVKAHGMLYGKKRRYEVIVQDETGAIGLVFFAGLRFFEKLFQKGQTLAATGTVSSFQGLQMVHPELERLDDESSKMVHAGRIIPVYPQTSELTKLGLTSRGIRILTTHIFADLKETFVDRVPSAERSRLHLIDTNTAMRNVHYPESRELITECRRRLAFDELLGLQYYVHQNRGMKEKLVKPHRYKAPADKYKQVMASLPYQLTPGQSKALSEITADLQKIRPMSRLLHGDVGCGKTVVAVIGAVYAAESGLQTAFMAPTEILAAQHFANWERPLAKVGIRTALLTSSLKAAQKKKIAEQCAAGEIDLLFGTHALIYDYISFPKLGLVVIDEQHRFGVEQRGKLFAKGVNPDLLIMTATPIPRTLALTLYGDLDISAITELPPGRKPIRTVWRTDDTRPKVLAYVKDEVIKGGQAYLVYPLIEKGDEDIQNVEDAFAELSTGPLNGLRIGMLHGRIKPKERDETLQSFRDKKLDVLLATSVIEVGLDNPNANLMVIEHAERFGLAQLHQLRGRVGRGAVAATVVALSSGPISDIARQRLEFFASTQNGFEIAEADLSLRGPGEVFGLRQSGLPDLRIANLSTDRDLLESARELCERLVFPPKDQPLASDYRLLLSYLQTQATARRVNLGGG